jgi:hypothetical protein
MPNGCCFAKHCAKAFGVIRFKNSGQGSDFHGFQKYGASATRALASMHSQHFMYA